MGLAVHLFDMGKRGPGENDTLATMRFLMLMEQTAGAGLYGMPVMGRVHIYLTAGGRASTRKVDQESPALQFDHGCQFIRAADPELTDQLIAMPQGAALYVSICTCDHQTFC